MDPPPPREPEASDAATKRLRVFVPALAGGVALAYGVSALDALVRFRGDPPRTSIGRIAWKTLGRLFGIVVFTILACAFGPAALLALVLLFSLSLLPWAVVDVGTDGLFVQFGKKCRFVPISDVRSIERTSGALVRVDCTGQAVTLAIRDKNGRNERARHAFVARVHSAMAKAKVAELGSHELAQKLARGDRGNAEWRQELNLLRGGGSGYRAAAMHEDALLGVIEDSTAPEDARAAASYLLLGSPDADVARTRLRVAADATASPKLRAALEADDAAIDEALAAYEAGAR